MRLSSSFLHRGAAAAAALLALSSSSVSAASPSSAPPRVNGWYPCAFSSRQSSADYGAAPVFECAEIEVPLCYDGVCDSARLINLFVKRRLATNAPPGDAPRKALILIEGGPGFAGTGMENVMESLLTLLDNSVDYYTFDHRGTGRSEFVQCDAAQALTAGSPSGKELSLDELQACLQDINFQYDGQAAAFSTTSAAMDVRTIISTFLSDHHVFVAGYSYGTFVTQRVMQLQVPQVVGYIFDGVDVLTTKKDPFESANSHWNEAIHTPGRRLLELCYDDALCDVAFSSRETVVEDVLAFMDELDASMDTNDCAQLLVERTRYSEPSVALRNWMGERVTYFTGRADALYMLGYAQRCTQDDLQAIQRLFDRSEQDASEERRRRLIGVRGDVPDPLNDASPLLYDVIVFSERWAQPAPTRDERNAFFLDGVFSSDDASSAVEYCVFTGSNEPACQELHDELPSGNQTFFYRHDKYFDAPLVLPDHASALILNGGLDFQTPKEFGELLYSKLDGSGSGVMMVTFDYGVHCAGEQVAESDGAPCHDAITAAFIANGGDVSKVTTNCMESLPDTAFH